MSDRPSRAPLGEELLDDPAADPALVRQSLGHIARSNAWFGGRAAVRFGLARLLAGQPRRRPLTLLDVGSGAGDLARDAVRWGARRGLELRPLALERHPAAARLSLEAGLPTVLGCAGALPVRERSVDIVVAAMLAHHLSTDAACALFQALTRVARLGVIVSDLRRSRVAAALFPVGARLLGFDAHTTHDGVTSIRRGYSAEELRGLLARAGIMAADVAERPGWRLVATWRNA
ncbi:MAG: methyltransferase domain-containing protein [Gemmatimonadales bacterium]|nr:methyltransferase domain-containing protein [Gemmatimonadales bacterium]